MTKEPLIHSEENRRINQVIQSYLSNLALSRSENTARTYRNALNVFTQVLREYHLDPETALIEELKENAVLWLARWLKAYSPTTERLYLTAVYGFFEYIAAEGLAEINLPRVKLLIRQRARRVGQRLPQFPRAEIDQMIDYAINLAYTSSTGSNEHLRTLRDRAFLLTLADSGLRVHEACNLRRGDIDWNEGKAVILGKGDQQAIVRFSSRVLHALKDYLAVRGGLDGATGRPLTSLPLFARHDKGAGKKIKPITTTTGRNIVAERVKEALGPGAVGRITPHSFRHYFVTTALMGSGGNLKLAQELARHKNITVTQRYAHLTDQELDEGYAEIFEN
jgi:site-specific recombinase XerD